MGYAKERGKFEKLAAKVDALKEYDTKNLTTITDVFEQYSHSIRILKNKNPEAFTELYKTDLEQIKLVRKALKESEEANRQESFISYRDALSSALNRAITVTKETA